MKPNEDFICSVCGSPDHVPSIITMHANYGSRNDGDSVTLYLCGTCIDKCIEYAKKLVVKGEYISNGKGKTRK